MNSLSHRVALVTGSSRGIGRSIALALAGEGCRILLHGFEPPATLAEVRDELLAGGAAAVESSGMDLLEPGAPASLVSLAEESLGSLDILVNNAGIQHVAPIDEFPDDAWDRVVELNLSVPFRLTRHALPRMRAKGWGRIVNIASVHGQVASVNKSAYVSAKHGLVGLTRTTALETAADPITCNAVCPGYVRTPLLESQIRKHAEARDMDPQTAARSFLGEKQPSGSFIPPEDIGAMVAFLCSGAGDHITGSTFTIDGGWTAQ